MPVHGGVGLHDVQVLRCRAVYNNLPLMAPFWDGSYSYVLMDYRHLELDQRLSTGNAPRRTDHFVMSQFNSKDGGECPCTR